MKIPTLDSLIPAKKGKKGKKEPKIQQQKEKNKTIDERAIDKDEIQEKVKPEKKVKAKKPKKEMSSIEIIQNQIQQEKNEAKQYVKSTAVKLFRKKIVPNL